MPSPSGSWSQDRKHHGGPDRAVCLYSLERILALQEEGHPIYPGAAGENLTLTGLDWEALQPGMTLRLGADVMSSSLIYKDWYDWNDLDGNGIISPSDELQELLGLNALGQPILQYFSFEDSEGFSPPQARSLR